MPRWSRNVEPSYSLRNRPRSCKSGTTSRLNSSNPPGKKGGMTLKPSAAPFSNHSCMRSATSLAVPMTIWWPRPAATRSASSRIVSFSRRASSVKSSARLRNWSEIGRSGSGPSRSYSVRLWPMRSSSNGMALLMSVQRFSSFSFSPASSKLLPMMGMKPGITATLAGSRPNFSTRALRLV
ncbi:hypothetical protein D3C80_1297870 [compost metagenome]